LILVPCCTTWDVTDGAGDAVVMGVAVEVVALRMGAASRRRDVRRGVIVRRVGRDIVVDSFDWDEPGRRGEETSIAIPE
jgi:hypothetical protein